MIIENKDSTKHAEWHIIKLEMFTLQMVTKVT